MLVHASCAEQQEDYPLSRAEKREPVVLVLVLLANDRSEPFSFVKCLCIWGRAPEGVTSRKGTDKFN